MAKTSPKQSRLRMLPGVDRILEISKEDPYLQTLAKPVLVRAIRSVIETLRAEMLSDKVDLPENALSESSLLETVKAAARQLTAPKLAPVINATGVVIHTNLGRSVLCQKALEQLSGIAGGYSNLEFDLETGKRGSRHTCVEAILCELSGAEAALVVNNNAGAVFLALDTMAKNKEVLISRGELVEIGGSFRIPDVMAKSGALLKEVGTTNRTHLKDYEGSIGSNTGLLLKVHKSNYSVEGFTAEVSLKELVALGEKYQIAVMEDLGSGTFIDFSRYGLIKEPTVQDSVQTGADVVTFSGDKLLGGPQAGIIVGRREMLDRIKKNPLARALRIDKLTLAALEATLSLYRDEPRAMAAIPTLQMMTLPLDAIRVKAKKLKRRLQALNRPGLHVQLMQLDSRVGGGALPLLKLPSLCLGVKLKGMPANSIDTYLRHCNPAVIGRIEDDFFIMDLRTVQDSEIPAISAAFGTMLERTAP
ncbi:MAG: L-seryl-tRNA(Sec) selenium transferase [Thermodesulfobacteriota bacterium]